MLDNVDGRGVTSGEHQAQACCEGKIPRHMKHWGYKPSEPPPSCLAVQWWGSQNGQQKGLIRLCTRTLANWRGGKKGEGGSPLYTYFMGIPQNLGKMLACLTVWR